MIKLTLSPRKGPTTGATNVRSMSKSGGQTAEQAQRRAATSLEAQSFRPVELRLPLARRKRGQGTRYP